MEKHGHIGTKPYKTMAGFPGWKGWAADLRIGTSFMDQCHLHG